MFYSIKLNTLFTRNVFYISYVFETASNLENVIYCLFSHALHHHLIDFFHAGGNGLPLQQMKALEDFKILESELKMRCARTEDLMRLFYMQVCEI